MSDHKKASMKVLQEIIGDSDRQIINGEEPTKYPVVLDAPQNFFEPKPPLNSPSFFKFKSIQPFKSGSQSRVLTIEAQEHQEARSNLRGINKSRRSINYSCRMVSNPKTNTSHQNILNGNVSIDGNLSFIPYSPTFKNAIEENLVKSQEKKRFFQNSLKTLEKEVQRSLDWSYKEHKIKESKSRKYKKLPPKNFSRAFAPTLNIFDEIKDFQVPKTLKEFESKNERQFLPKTAVWNYKKNSDYCKWRPESRVGSTITLVGQHAFLFGGNSTKNFADIHAFDLSTSIFAINEDFQSL